MITTIGINTFNECIPVRKCSEPNLNVKCIYDILKYKYYPFRKIKSVVHSPLLKKNETQQYCGSQPNYLQLGLKKWSTLFRYKHRQKLFHYLLNL